MDSSSHRDNGQSSQPSPTSASRKRERENETPSQRHKREKAAERQRRKRERDRNSNSNASGGRTGSNGTGMAFPTCQHLSPPPPESTESPFSPEEQTRRAKVRLAARDRQRKHRELVRLRKLRELGLDMGNEIPDSVQYRDGQYQQVMVHELPHGVMVHHEPPFPQGQPSSGGETFASTLLLSFSCAPLLKQHLLRTLQMTNEELASLEPIIADAWEHWDHQVRFLLLQGVDFAQFIV